MYTSGTYQYNPGTNTLSVQNLSCTGTITGTIAPLPSVANVVTVTGNTVLPSGFSTVFLTGSATGGTYTLPTTSLANGFVITIVKIEKNPTCTITATTGFGLYSTDYLNSAIVLTTMRSKASFVYNSNATRWMEL